jgi:uncharacterized protein (UPF0548 family)
MKIFLSDQSDLFAKHLSHLKDVPVISYKRNLLKHSVSTIHIPRANWSNARAAMFNYQIFPTNIMSALGEWQTGAREMRTGDTILQQIFLPPLRSISQKIIFGVRVNRIIEEVERIGFSYETLHGHVEKGESTFTIERHFADAVFKIETFSGPGNVLSLMTGPFFGRPYQAYCTRKALENVRMRVSI